MSKVGTKIFAFFLVAELCVTGALLMDKISSNEWWVGFSAVVAAFAGLVVVDRKLNGGK